MKIQIDNISGINYAFKDSELKAWMRNIAEMHSKKVGHLQYVLCNDEYLHRINVDHLDHDDYTDIITFDYSELNILTGEIYISMDRVVENSKKLQTGFNSEFCRVLSHGILHLIGFKDKSDNEKKVMRAEEDRALKLLL
jgi:rRNA maturation RNase YbeY